MIELKMEEINERLAKREDLFVFIYTPLCGTCTVAKKMLEVVEEMLPMVKIYTININQAPTFAQKWQVKSVPALYIFQKGFSVKQIYAFHSIMHVHQLLLPYTLMEKGDI
ncbi:thioredoxin family protein [Halalkalibacter sp. APA_J-10(15)]|uniref:thioredoxin family protein n=1 Tax=unclassified Halalkalibacter TaxID=2893063 RepID=UPI001FF308C7|nr:thioredoxin family protein [Halalkalibacter sp. APA_J-10(15)]MCK0472063.1 thioredoxin family protein [Halalkalibacter sp. APA_J-10(15)]